MKAFILAAGKGERLRPLTDSLPKPMIPLNGRPLLEYTVEWLRGHGFDDLVINLHHLPDVVKRHFGDGKRFEVRIRYSFEPELLGTSGALAPWRDFFGEGTFLVMYGDNLTNCDLQRPLRLHQAKQALATIVAHEREDVTKSGMVVMGEDDRVQAFREKPAPEEAVSHWVSAGMLLAEPGIFEDIPESGFSDFGRDVFPALLTRGAPVYGYRMTEAIRWADTVEDYRRLQELAAAGQLL
jgi:mannose-1-phosphate guanylyltransferase